MGEGGLCATVRLCTLLAWWLEALELWERYSLKEGPILLEPAAIPKCRNGTV